jgi:hypothetical protein
MDFLSLGQQLVLQCGISGSLSTMQNQTGEFGRVVNWIGRAWNELQTKHDDWDWMRSSNLLGAGVSFVTVAGQAVYPLGVAPGNVGITAAVFGKWDETTFRAFTTSVGFQDETFLDPIDYDDWRDAYMYGAMRTVQTRPVAVAIGPNKSVCLGPPSDGTYTVTGDYFTAPTAMSADNSEPTGLPAQFQMLIVYKAMQYYAAYESAPEVQAAGDAGWKTLLPQLESIQAVRVGFAGALA